MEGDQEKIGGIFESLKPSDENLQMLEVRGYYGSKIPSWMQELSSFTKLIEVHLLNCRNIKQLPSLGMLPFLKDLEISDNNEIERVGHEFIGDAVVAFPKLEKLYFGSLHKWIEWEMRSLENEQQIIMPCLCKLRIVSCPKLKSWPELGKLPSLEYLLVEGNEVVERVGHELYGHCDGGDDAKGIAFPKLKRLQFSKMYEWEDWEDWELRVENGQSIMPSLLELNIKSCPKLKSLPECLLAKLVTLSIHDSNEINCMSSTSPLPCLANLEKLYITETISLPHNGWEQLKSLHTLRIYGCDMESLPTSIGQLKSLQVLSFLSCEKLRSLPDEFPQLQSLLSLDIKICNQLESLPTSIGQLKSLQELNISFCSQLRSFPDELTQLQSLRTLRIDFCSQLKKVLCHQQKKHFNCWMPSSSVASTVGGGEDWHKIKHIPNIIIDGKTIQSEKDG